MKKVTTFKAHKAVYKVMVLEGDNHNSVFYSENKELAEQFCRGVSAFYEEAFVMEEYLFAEIPEYLIIHIESNEGAANESHVMYTTDTHRCNLFISSPSIKKYTAHICLPFGDSKQAKKEAEQKFKEYQKLYSDYKGYIKIHPNGTIEKEPEEK